MNNIDRSGFTVNRRAAFGLRASAGLRQSAFGLDTSGFTVTGRQPSAGGLPQQHLGST
jgi:hypothetical protein